MVYLLSSLYNVLQVVDEAQKKTKVIKDYNASKNGWIKLIHNVDKADSQC